MEGHASSKVRSRSVARAQDRLVAFRRAIEVAEDLLNRSETAEDPAQREYFLGLAQYQLEDYAAASRHLQASFQVDEQAETAARLGVCSWRDGKLADAEAWLTRAIELAPDGRIQTQIAGTTPSFHAVLAQVMLAGGRVDDAAATATGALKLDGKDTAALGVLATTQLAKGEGQAALKTLEAAIATAPPFIAERLARQQALASELVAANVNLRPFAAGLGDIGRIIV